MDVLPQLPVGMDMCGDFDSDMELGLEIFEILQGSLSNRSTVAGHSPGVRPPSRNSNPLLKDQRFSCSALPMDRDTIASMHCSAMCEDLRNNFAFGCSLAKRQEVLVGSS
eukprot:3927779-Rhodomonas_salina.1